MWSLNFTHLLLAFVSLSVLEDLSSSLDWSFLEQCRHPGQKGRAQNMNNKLGESGFGC